MKTKNIISTGVLLLWLSISYGQSTPEAFLGLMPSIPTIDCGMESSRQVEAITAFQTQLNNTQDLLSQAIRDQNKKNKQQGSSADVKRQAASQSTLSEDELATVSDKNSSSSDKNRLVNQSVEGQTGFSMDEMQQVKKMSAADRQKWAMQNYGNAMQTQKSNSSASKSGQPAGGSLAELAAEQQSIAQNLQHHYARLSDMKQNIDNAAAEQQILLDNRLKAINQKYADVNDGEGSTSEDMRKLREKNKLIRDAKVEYCSKLTPLNTDYLVNYHNVLTGNILPDLKRQEDINHQLRNAALTHGEKSELERLRAVKKYGDALSSAFAYYLNVNSSTGY